MCRFFPIIILDEDAGVDLLRRNGGCNGDGAFLRGGIANLFSQRRVDLLGGGVNRLPKDPRPRRGAARAMCTGEVMVKQLVVASVANEVAASELIYSPRY